MTTIPMPYGFKAFEEMDTGSFPDDYPDGIETAVEKRQKPAAAKNTVARRGPADPGYPRGWGPLTRPPFSKEMFPEGGYA
jgi:hypothetical protein